MHGRGLGLGAVILGVVLGLAGPGCGGGECKDRIAAMRATLAQVPANADFTPAVEVGAAAPLPATAKGEAVRGKAPLLRVGKDGLLLDGEAVAADGVVSRVAAAIEAPGLDRAVYVAFAPDTPVAPHRGWLMDVPAEVRILVRVPMPAGPQTPAGDAALARARAASESFERVTALADELRAVAANCKQLETGFGSLAAAPVDRKQGMVINLAIDGATACGCDRLDVDKLSALVWYMLMGDDPGLRWLPLKIEVGASRLIPGDATAEQMARILESESRLGFAPH